MVFCCRLGRQGGTVANFLLDGDKGTVRSLVVDTVGRLMGRIVLLSLQSVQQVVSIARNIHVRF